jgi:hypothetical protein
MKGDNDLIKSGRDGSPSEPFIKKRKFTLSNRLQDLSHKK